MMTTRRREARRLGIVRGRVYRILEHEPSMLQANSFSTGALALLGGGSSIAKGDGDTASTAAAAAAAAAAAIAMAIASGALFFFFDGASAVMGSAIGSPSIVSILRFSFFDIKFEQFAVCTGQLGGAEGRTDWTCLRRAAVSEFKMGAPKGSTPKALVVGFSGKYFGRGVCTKTRERSKLARLEFGIVTKARDHGAPAEFAAAQRGARGTGGVERGKQDPDLTGTSTGARCDKTRDGAVLGALFLHVSHTDDEGRCTRSAK